MAIVNEDPSEESNEPMEPRESKTLKQKGQEFKAKFFKKSMPEGESSIVTENLGEESNEPKEHEMAIVKDDPNDGSAEKSNEPKETKKSKTLKQKRDEIKAKFFNRSTDNAEKRKKILIPKDKKLRKPKKVGNVLLINPKNYQKDKIYMKIINVIVDTFYEFAGITKVNGMYYLRRFVTHGFQRLLWSCIMISLLSFAATLIYLLYRRFQESPTRVTIAPSLLIHEIPFPGITICHPQNVMEYKSKEFLSTA